MKWFKNSEANTENLIDDAFLLGILGKGIGGIVEFLAGVLLVFISLDQLIGLLSPLHGLGLHLEDDVSSGVKQFVAINLVARGGIRVVLAWALFKEKIWAYPATIAILFGIIFYQIWLMLHSFSTGLLALTILDVLIIWLTWHEYNKLRRGGHIRFHKL